MVRTTVGHFPASVFFLTSQCVYISEFRGEGEYSHLLSFLSATRAYTLTLGTAFFVKQDVHNECRAGCLVTRPKNCSSTLFFRFCCCSFLSAILVSSTDYCDQFASGNRGLTRCKKRNKQQPKRNLHTGHTLRISCRAPPQRCVLLTWTLRTTTIHILQAIVLVAQTFSTCTQQTQYISAQPVANVLLPSNQNACLSFSKRTRTFRRNRTLR